MNQKTIRLQEAMELQSIGVEIEMNNISRRDAAKLAAEFFGTGHWEDTARRHRYKTYSAWDQQGREWKFSRDSSIVGPDEMKCELITPILHHDDIETLQELVRCLRRAGAQSNHLQGCGCHVHIGADGHTPQTLRNLVNLMASHEALIFAALQIDQDRINTYCKPVNQEFLKELNEKKPATMRELADIWYTSQGYDYCRNDNYNRSRYRALNLHATFTKSTIEFRLFEFLAPSGDKKNGLHAGRLKTFIQLALALSAKAKEVKTASPKPVTTDNPKFTMRTWLNSLGMIGDEFETARKILTENLAGDAAFRFGRAA